MFCMHCGKQINEGSAFCSVCGKPQQQAQTSAVSTDTASTQVAVTSKPQGIAALDMPTLLETIRIANSVIKAYLEISEHYENLDNFQQWGLVAYEAMKGVKYWLGHKVPSLEEYGLDVDFLNEYNQSKKVWRDARIQITVIEGAASELFAKKIAKENLLQADIGQAKAELEVAENNLNANIEYVNLIPENYRYPFALDEIYSYLADHRAESWKEAVNLYEEQLHRWKLEENSEEALLLQAQTAALAGRAASSAGTAALFSGLNFFFK